MSNIDELRQVTKTLLKLLDEPEPGCSTWKEAVHKTCGRVLEFAPAHPADEKPPMTPKEKQTLRLFKVAMKAARKPTFKRHRKLTRMMESTSAERVSVSVWTWACEIEECVFDVLRLRKYTLKDGCLVARGAR